jgi:YidC/Oxa1 family membrane protein insertase
MDRNSAIGLALIAVLLLVYFNFFSPTPTPPENKPSQVIAADTLKNESAQLAQEKQLDSATLKQYGQLSTYLSGNEETVKVENSELSLIFSNRGSIKEVELKNFKTYDKQPLLLAAPTFNRFELKTNYEGKEIDLYQLYYTAQTQKRGDTAVVTYTAQIDASNYLKHTYKIPPTGFQIGYQFEVNGVNLGDQITYQWSDRIPLQEKDLTDSRNKTTVNYFTAGGDFDGISEAAADLETETLASPIKWAAIRQKFFISSIIAKNSFSGGEVSTVVKTGEINTVKNASLKLFIPKQDAISGNAKFNYYFGPNDFETLNGVAEDFQRNLNIGWPPVKWVNQFLIIPIFKFLEQFIGNYGIIIIILVFVVKLILSPLSYKSYIGMAKMKLLKPELDVIKEKYGDNMTQIQAEQMKLYQQAGVSPFSGCIPLLLQMPILFAMFYFFPVSIQLRQKSFLWADDLSTYDSIASLPFSIPFYGDHVSLFVLLMTATTIITQWQNNQVSSVTGPMKSMGYFMPVIFMFVLNNFSAGLSFYYFVANVVTFGQQAIIKRFVDEDKIKAVMDEHRKKLEAGGGTTGTKSKFMSKLQEAMKASEEAKKKAKK